MTIPPGPDHQIDLSVLLDDEADSEQFRALSAHVDACPECQRRLTELAGDENYWLVQRQMLHPVEGDLSEAHLFHRYRSAETARATGSRVDESTIKDLLAAPSHPEMLGRLGRYEIERIIGAGGMGIVLKGFDSELNRPVAIKVLAPHLARVGAARQRFAREARAAAAVVHEHVVPIYNVESGGPHPFLVMQFIPGESLQVRVEREGPLSVAEILRIGAQAASGLAEAHAQGLVHRDVKPANILLESGVERAFLTDFGLARAADDASLTCTGVLAGTPHYMSPEQADGQPLDHRSDLFSLGSVLYFMATGHPPFRADRPMAVLKRICHDAQRPAWHCNAEVPEALSTIIDRLLEKTPARRFATARAVRDEIRQVLATLQRTGFRRRSRWAREFRRHTKLIGGVIAVCVVAAFAWSLIIPALRDQTDVNGNQAERKQPPAGALEPEFLPPAGFEPAAIDPVALRKAADAHEQARRHLERVDRLHKTGDASDEELAAAKEDYLRARRALYVWDTSRDEARSRDGR